jgi:hypothetical protein
MTNKQSYDNKLINNHRVHIQSNNPYTQNTLLNNNPQYVNCAQDRDFYNRINTQKIQRQQQKQTIKDFNLTKEQLTNYVIRPLKLEKPSSEALIAVYNDRKQLYNNGETTEVSQYIKNLWNQRQNTPYKTFLTKGGGNLKIDYTKKYETQADLIVHKVSTFDKDRVRLNKKLILLNEKILGHDGELKIMYSVSKKAEHLEKFEYVHKIKNRVKFDPKDSTDLKEYYKKQQKKEKKINKRLNEALELLAEDENITKEDLDEIKNEIQKNNSVIDNSKYDFEDDDNSSINKQVDKEIKKQLKNINLEDLDEHELTKLIEELEPKQKEIKKINLTQKSRITMKKVNNDTVPKIKSHSDVLQIKEHGEIGYIDPQDMAKYKKK